MNPIIDHLDIWTGALEKKASGGRGNNGKLSPYGIQKLRELILELAVRGRLVPQDSNDEPASVLLEKIAGEKARLVKEGKIRKPKKLPDISQEEIPYRVPDGWSWQRFVDVFYPISVSKNKVKTSEIQETGKISVVDQGQSYVAGYTDNIDLVIKIPGPVIVFGDHTTALKYVDFDFVAGADGVKILRPILVYEKYFYLVTQILPIENRGYGRHYSRLLDNLFPVPPLAEQHRIVAKVDELMALCDRLEQEQTDSRETHQTLVETLLRTLVEAPNAEAAQQAWQRIAQHFDILFTTETAIDQLKQTILQLAVMGKLVPQNPNDEPASVLLEKIAREKARLVKEEGLKTKAKNEIDREEEFIERPDGWEYLRLGNLAKFIDYRGRTPKKIDAGVPLITTKNVRFGYISREPREFISEEEYTTWMTRGLPRVGDILFTTEAPLGNVAIVDIAEKFALAQRVICFQLHVPETGPFLRLLMMSSAFQQQLSDKATGMTATGIKAAKLKEIPVPMPPLAEQHRIVAKVDELMALCDALKARIQQAETTQRHLADAIVEQTVA